VLISLADAEGQKTFVMYEGNVLADGLMLIMVVELLLQQ